MKIAILASESRKTKDRPVIEEAAQAFDTFIYAPITKVRFDLASAKSLSILSLKRFTSEKSLSEMSVKCNGYDLSDADCLLVIPTSTHAELFYTALRILDNCVVPFDAKTYMLTINEGLLFNFLGAKGIPIRESLIVASNISIDKINERIKYPVIVRPPRKRVMVTNTTTLKDVLSLYSYGTPIRIETPIRSERNVWAFVLEDDVIAGYEKTKDAPQVTAIDDDLKRLAIKVRDLIGCNYCAMRFLYDKNKWVIDKLTFSPDFSNFQKITGVNIGRHIVSNLRNKVRKRERPKWHEKVEHLFRFRRVSAIGESETEAKA